MSEKQKGRKIFIFVPVYFREELVRQSVESLLETYESGKFIVRIFLIDNRSNDSLREYLKEVEERFPIVVTTILLNKNHGKTKAINKAAADHCMFDYFINYDSDIKSLMPGWPGKLVKCFSKIEGAGMVSMSYVGKNNPMPKQPKRVDNILIGDKTYTFLWGGAVAGGCFVTDRQTWSHVKYRTKGMYGGVDGLFRQMTADQLKKKCGHIKEIKCEHLLDLPEYSGYAKWKRDIQSQIKKIGPRGDPKKLGNAKGYYDK